MPIRQTGSIGRVTEGLRASCVQHPTSKGLLTHGLGNLVGDVLMEVPVWTRLTRPVPTPVQDLAEQAEKLRTTAASVTAIVRTYNQVGAGMVHGHVVCWLVSAGPAGAHTPFNTEYHSHSLAAQAALGDTLSRAGWHAPR